MKKFLLSEKKNLMLDMDDVIVSEGFLTLINLFLGTNFKEEDFNNFYMQEKIPEAFINDFFDFVFKEGFYKYCKINDNAYEVIELLNKKYNLYIGTSYIFPEVISKSGIILFQKYEFLTQQFPFLHPNNFVFLTDKTVLNCHIRVDDSIKNLEGPNVERKILYTAYHNKGLSDEFLQQQNIERAHDWQHVKKLLL